MKYIGALFVIASVLISSLSFADSSLKYPPGSDKRFNWQSYEQLKSMNLKGQKISVFGPWLGPDKALVESVIAYFEAATGAEVEYSGSDSLEQQIVIDAKAGSAPNITIFPQPGLAADLAGQGFLSPLDKSTANWVENNYAAGKSWVDLATFTGADGKKNLYGFFFKVDVKSLVWYSPENFEDGGYEVPETMEDLKALTQQIVKDGGTPWCIGIGSGDRLASH